MDTKDKKGTSTKLSKSWSEAVEAFNKAEDTKDAILILSHSNKRWYKVSGQKNPNGLYTDAFTALADYVQTFKNYTGPLMSEKDAEFYTEEDAESSWKDKLQKIDGILDGKDEPLAQNYHFFAVTFDRKTKQYNYLVWQPVRSMKTGLEYVTKAIYKSIVKPNKDMAFMITCRETVPLYCSEGEMTDPACQGMIGYALVEGWLVADKKMVNRQIP